MASDGFKDYFKILGVSRNATDKEIKSAFRKLARQFHPDLHPHDDEAESEFKEINEAYEILSDVDKKKSYEEYLSYWSKNSYEKSKDSAIEKNDKRFDKYKNFDDFLSDLIGRFSEVGQEIYSNIYPIFIIFCLSWSIGLIIPAAPGGIGVFEACFIFLSRNNYSESALIMSLIYFRIISTLTDLSLSAPFLWKKYIRR